MVTPKYELIVMFADLVESQREFYENLLTGLGFESPHWVQNKFMALCSPRMFNRYPEKRLEMLMEAPAGTTIKYEVAPPQ